MRHSVARWFSKSDFDRIAAAVHDAESRTSGEIVPYVVDHSDHYEDAEWRAAILFAFLVFVLTVALRRLMDSWAPLDAVTLALVTIAAGGVGLLLVRLLPSAKRLFAGKAQLDRRVSQRAAEAFVAEEVFKTRERTGILLFVSILERRVLVLGDTGIHAKVAQSDWHDIVQRVVAGIRAKRPAEGLIEGIRQCGVLLEKHHVAIRRDDRNELPDTLRTSDT